MDSLSTTAAGRPRAARAGVTVLFFCNGALFANWVPRVPAVKASLELTDTVLGLALLGVGLGALLGSIAAAPLVAARGSRAASLLGCVALGLTLALPGLAPAPVALAGALLVLGFGDAVMDVGMNVQGVEVQRSYGRSVMNGFHASWSIGAVAGSLAGSLAAGAGVPVAVHLALAGALLGAAGLATAPALRRGADRDRPGSSRVLVRPTRALAVLGLVALLAGVVEDTPGSWSAVLLRDALGAPPAAAGTAFAAFAAAMTAGRLVADRLVTRAGAVRVARSGALLAALGLGAGLLAGTPAAAVAAFGAVGFGVSALFPVFFSAAGALPGVPPGAGIAFVSLAARLGFLVAPPAVGAVAGVTGLPAALGLVVAAATAVALLARGVDPQGG